MFKVNNKNTKMTSVAFSNFSVVEFSWVFVEYIEVKICFLIFLTQSISEQCFNFQSTSRKVIFKILPKIHKPIYKPIRYL